MWGTQGVVSAVGPFKRSEEVSEEDFRAKGSISWRHNTPMHLLVHVAVSTSLMIFLLVHLVPFSLT